jgi:hypothetical protein
MINVTDNIKQVLSFTDRLDRQYQFAVAKALTDVARSAAKAMPTEVQHDLEDPTPFTLRGFFSTRAEKAKPVAEVGVKDLQAKYLRYQIEGGQRRPTKKALRLPATVQLDSFGNLPKGTIRRLVAAAKSGRRVGGKRAQKLGVAESSEIFYGKPRGGAQRPPGLYVRRKQEGRQVLVPLVVFPARSATYRQRFDFYAKAEQIVRREFEPTLRRAWALAKATARG